MGSQNRQDQCSSSLAGCRIKSSRSTSVDAVEEASNILERHSAAGTNTCTSICDAPQETRVILESILEPIILRFKANEDAGTRVSDDRGLHTHHDA